jgi:hypothetical protein
VFDPAPTLLLVHLRWPPDSIVLVRTDEATDREATYREAAQPEVRIAQQFRVPKAGGAWSATWRCALIGASRGLVALAFEAAVIYVLAMAAGSVNPHPR